MAGSISFNFNSTMSFNLHLPELMNFVSQLNDGDYTLTVEKKKVKRSLNANAYYWVLVNTLSEKINVPPSTIYRQHIQDVGGNYEIVPIRDDAVDTWQKNWKNKGLGWICESIGESKLRGYTNMICFYGSSTYDSKQMSRLIDLCVQDCKAQDIDTMTEQERSLLLDQWAKSSV